jgi:uncharacterized protein YcbX
MQVEAIYIAPVKSLHLQRVEEASVAKTGLVGDREFFLVTDKNRLFTMRDFGPLAAVRAEYVFEHELLRFEFSDGRAIEAKPLPGDPVTARFFGKYDVAAYEVPGPWNDALKLFTGMPVRLVKAAEQRSGVDALPVSLLSDASLEALRGSSGEKAFEERRFRPNIYISGAERAHQEDEWIDTNVRVGSAVIRVRLRDERCAVTTLNPDTGERDKNTLKLITAYRTDQPKEANFGVYGTVEQEGEIHVGDAIEVLGPVGA